MRAQTRPRLILSSERVLGNGGRTHVNSKGNSHRLNESPAKDGVWNGLPRQAHSHAQSSVTKTSVDLLSWARRSQWE